MGTSFQAKFSRNDVCLLATACILVILISVTACYLVIWLLLIMSL